MKKEIFITIVALSIFALPFFLHPYVVTGHSMEPAYHSGDRVLVETFTPRLHVWRGEVLVIYNPHDKAVIEIKRVIGLPNEDVNISDKTTTSTLKNGQSETFGAPFAQPGTVPFGMHLGPEDYLVLGDNRAHSSDSRVFGAVQAGDIIGHVILKI